MIVLNLMAKSRPKARMPWCEQWDIRRYGEIKFP